MSDVPRWPVWKKIVAYAVLLAIAVASIWFIDQAAVRPGP